MWTIVRKDDNYEVQAAYRMKDLSFDDARKSGFVGPDDDLVMLRPDGSVKAEDSALVWKARRLGSSTARMGGDAIPVFDETLMDLLKGLEVGEGIAPLEAWLEGWNEANEKLVK